MLAFFRASGGRCSSAVSFGRDNTRVTVLDIGASLGRGNGPCGWRGIEGDNCPTVIITAWTSASPAAINRPSPCRIREAETSDRSARATTSRQVQDCLRDDDDDDDGRVIDIRSAGYLYARPMRTVQARPEVAGLSAGERAPERDPLASHTRAREEFTASVNPALTRPDTEPLRKGWTAPALRERIDSFSLPLYGTLRAVCRSYPEVLTRFTELQKKKLETTFKVQR